MTRFLFMTLLIILALSGCDKTDDAARIRAVCDDLVQSAELHATSAMFAHTTSDFIAYPGGLDAHAAREMLLLTFRRYGTFDVVHPRFEIHIDREKEEATVSVPFAIVPKGSSGDDISFDSHVADPGAWIETVGDPYHLKLTLQKRQNDWKVRRVDLTNFKRAGGL